MAGSIGRRGLVVAVAASLIAVPGASAQSVLEMDPYMQGRCPSDDGRGFQINFNPNVNAWPVYEHTECGPRHPGEAPAPSASTPASASEPARPRSTSPARPEQPATPVRRKAKRARCAKRYKRARWRCVGKARSR